MPFTAARQALNRLQLSSRLVQAKRSQPLSSTLLRRQIHFSKVLLSAPNAQSSDSPEHIPHIFPTVPSSTIPLDTTQLSNTDETKPSLQEQLAGASDVGSENVDDFGTDTAGGEARTTKGRGRPVGSKGRRLVTTKVKELPKPEIPTWFYDNGVFLKEHSLWSDPSCDLVIVEEPVPESTETEKTKQDEQSEATKSTEKVALEAEADTTETKVVEQTETKTEIGQVEKAIQTTAQTLDAKEEVKETEPAKDSEAGGNRYTLPRPVWNEIIAHVRVGLLLPKAASGDYFASVKAHSILHCPKEGGIYFLDSVTEKIARAIGADLVRIDAQDLEEIVGDYLGATRSSKYLGFISERTIN